MGLIQDSVQASCTLPSKAFTGTLQKISGRDQIRVGNNSRIPRCWGSPRNKFAGCKAFNPLVCNPKRGKAPVNYQLQGNKSLLGAKTFQVRELARNFSLPQERNVGSKNRLKACLFSFGDIKGAKTLHMHSNRKQGFSVSSSMFWNEHVTTTVANRHEGVSKKNGENKIF